MSFNTESYKKADLVLLKKKITKNLNDKSFIKPLISYIYDRIRDPITFKQIKNFIGKFLYFRF